MRRLLTSSVLTFNRRQHSIVHLFVIRNARDHPFLMTDSRAGYIVAKRAFANSEQEQSFFDALDHFRTYAHRGDA